MNWKEDAKKHFIKCKPAEGCGFLVERGGNEFFYPCKNIAREAKLESFVIDPLDYANVEDSVDEIIGIVHSHPQDVLEFSESDKYSCKSIDLTFYLVSPKSDKIAVMRPDEIDA